MRLWSLLLMVLCLGAQAQFFVGGSIRFGTTSGQPNFVPPESATFLASECDTAPRFPGGEDAWMRHMLDAPGCTRVPVPAACVYRTKVVVRFVVEKDGSLGDVYVASGNCAELEQLALCAVLNSPAWEPARINGYRVRTRMEVPVRFTLEQRTDRP